MSKTITVRQMAAIKRVAQNVNPLVTKKNKLMEKIISIREEIESLNDEILGHEVGVRTLTGGLVSEDLIVKKIETTNKTDKNGNPIKVTKYEPNEDVVIFNSEANIYEIIEKEPEHIPVSMIDSFDYNNDYNTNNNDTQE